MANRGDSHDIDLLLFGPQTGILSADVLKELQSSLQSPPQESQRPHWILTTLGELHSLWSTWTTRIPKLEVVPASRPLINLHRYLTGSADTSSEEMDLPELPNAVYTPLIVLTQLRQFEHYIGSKYGSMEEGFDALKSRTQVLGFCTGLLSAYAVGSSSTKEDFEHYGATAIRLASLIGAAIDACDNGHGKSISFTITWRTEAQEAKVEEILAEFEGDAYKSVLYDDYRSTITVSEVRSEVILDRLCNAGITATKLDLRGRFHTAANQHMLDQLLELCRVERDLQLPDAALLRKPSYANLGNGPLTNGSLHEIAVRALLVQQADWHGTLAYACRKSGDRLSMVSFGIANCVPKSLRRLFAHHHVLDIGNYGCSLDCPTSEKTARQQRDTDIAIIGLSIKVAGADHIDEFSALLRSGESQHTEVDILRVPFGTSTTPWRSDSFSSTQKWFGNFVRDIDAFDHHFFRRSPRECAAMDPQQRLFLQASYQAVESTGWLSQHDREQESGMGPNKHMGVYVGTCSTDYEHNVACHQAGAYSTTGLLRSFIAGKVAHYFGWTGPAMTFDTACSGSAVAIHTACKALLHGECSAALCGGVNLMMTPILFQNLAGASFLSPTGQCKPFDDQADGYCRGEGIACVILKPMKAALADGDRIFGCIPSTAVYQNDNSTPVFVPNSPSLSRLFSDVIKDSGLKPQDISLVEAHGTGTPVGDPAEYDSIRRVLGGLSRTEPLHVGSVKGLIGHTESTSGIVSLIKVITLMNESFIPAQPSFSKLSRNINSSIPDMIEVPKSLRTWGTTFKAALINNYGASGSNASLVVCEAPYSARRTNFIHNCTRQPFRITGFNDRSIEVYCAKLLIFLKRRYHHLSLADVAFNIARQSNRLFTHGLVFSCDSVVDLIQKLDSKKMDYRELRSERPVILCFGGQVSRCIGLDRRIYQGIHLLQRYLHECDTIVRSFGVAGIFPAIFSRKPIMDPICLQTSLFALQYACAKSWIDCGVKVQAVIGHSFGEITALCVSGVLNLRDTVKLIIERAGLVKNAWGTDPGVMMSVYGELSVMKRLVSTANGKYEGRYPVSIACYNSPSNFTLAGSTEAMTILSETLSTVADFMPLKNKTIKVTNAFHSTLVEPLCPGLRSISENLAFNEPKIPLERATELESFGHGVNKEFAWEHMCHPVFFHHAVERLSKKYPSCVWLEAGSSSGVTTMISRTLGSAPDTHVQPVNITTSGSLEALNDATIGLWREGVDTFFWAHHSTQTHKYKALLLPPYQFEKTRHWLDFKPYRDAMLLDQGSEMAASSDIPTRIWTFTRFLDSERQNARFRINTETVSFQSMVVGHVVVETAPICPTTVQVCIAIEALSSLIPKKQSISNGFPVIRNVQNHFALCVNPTREVWLDLKNTGQSWEQCAWRIFTNSKKDKEGSETICVDGHIELLSPKSVGYQAEFARFERLVSYERCVTLLRDAAGKADDIMHGRNLYRAFSEIVDYGAYYQGVKRVVGRANECAGNIQLRQPSETWFDVPLLDSCSQVAGIWVNFMTDRTSKDVFLATGCEMIMRSPRYTSDFRTESYHVFARHHLESEKVYISDVFVFDPNSGQLLEILIGIRYSKVAKAGLRKILSMLTGDTLALKFQPAISSNQAPGMSSTAQLETSDSKTEYELGSFINKNPELEHDDTRQQLKLLVADICGLKPEKIHDRSKLEDLGIDSLMGMELSREIQQNFGCKLDQTDLLEASDFRTLVIFISRALHGDRQELSEVEVASSHHGSTTPSDQLGVWSEISTTSATSSPTKYQPDDLQKINGEFLLNTIEKSILSLKTVDIVSAFRKVKWSTDQFLIDAKLDKTDSAIIARSNRLCVALIVEAFETLGSPLRTASPGQLLERIPHLSQHTHLVNWIYKFLSKDARLINMEANRVFRTSIAAPQKSSETLYNELLQASDPWLVAHELTSFAGKHLADVLLGKTDGISLLFGSTKGRSLIEGLYGDLPFNQLAYKQMCEVIRQLSLRIPHDQGVLRILEVGGGTGGTTRVLADCLARLPVPIEYTFTDISPSMVAQARKKFKAFPFMRYAVHDIEKPPAEELKQQHIVLASNAVHATHNLERSAAYLKEALREDGFLMLTEMTERIPFVDLIFGLLEGWWLFNDGREHALVSEIQWEKELKTAGFDYVDWTDGNLIENKIQRVIIATISNLQQKIPGGTNPPISNKNDQWHGTHREEEAEKFVTKYASGFEVHTDTSPNSPPKPAKRSSNCVSITGGTGSLGAHLVAAFASHPAVRMVICLNRQINTIHKSNLSTGYSRQDEAFSTRGISITPTARSKLKVFEIDINKPNLGLSADEHAFLVHNITHIVHNAWPMSSTRQVQGFESQFLLLRKLLDQAAAAQRHNRARITFQLISSIGVVGNYPIKNDKVNIPETRVPLTCVPRIGYCEGKWICERILDETLHRYPQSFRAMTIRPGQISGSRISGYWNHIEHFAFLIKSAQTLQVFPALQGRLQWVPVDVVATTIVDLAMRDGDACPVYHIDNPVGQPWEEMVPLLMKELGIPIDGNIIPFKNWIRQVKRSPLSIEHDNPASRLVDFLENHFEHMSCGELILDTSKARDHSKTLAALGPIPEEVVKKYIRAWKTNLFLL